MNIIFFQFPFLTNVYCVFSGRDPAEEQEGNISWSMPGDRHQTARNRDKLLAACSQFAMRGWAECRQVHGTQLLYEPAALKKINEGEGNPAADGMMTSETGIGLLIKTADCQPVLLTDREGKHIMALHVGWRGNRSHFVTSAVESFCRYYTLAPENLFAVRGPSLGPNNAEFINFATEWGEEFIPWFNKSTKRMNLWDLTRSQLLCAGLSNRNIFEIPVCTYENCHAWFSHRRRSTGRQASVIWICNPGYKGLG